MRVGLIGAGPRAEILARSVPPWVEIVGVASLTGESSSILSKVISVPQKSVQEILRPTDIKSVIISTPIDTLNDVVSESIRCGKHVFVEKPGMTSSVRCQETLDQSLLTGRVVRVGFSWVDDFTSSLDDEWSTIDINWTKRETRSDDLVMNLACHPISLLTSWGLDLKSIEWVKSSNSVLGSAICQGKCVKILISVDPQKEDRLEVKIDGKNVSRRPQKNSASRQLMSFFEDVRSQKIRGQRDLSFTLSVLNFLGV